MLKKLFMLCVAVVLSLSAGFAAAVEVNTADQAALESVKGIGPVHAKAILDERAKNGPFKNADDLAARVKGLGQKSVENLEAAGLTVNGSSAPPTGAKTSTKSAGTAATKTAPAAAAATTTAAPAPAATTAPAAAAPASAEKPSKSKKKGKAAASDAAAASAPAAAAASAPADASGTKASKKKAKNSKAASAAAASGA
ncbi:helix-hairpin-helix domain-containing protein [Paraburkholderia sp. UYCP14C]|uniref:ComEA family DNA-binding protein n=1 Tax=Paraburkholderia sp. UYCP14C TaxID=2511130 RepID=UPI0010214151|nr:helix-hairpin-helix domain-containing protein [Paraburkholderia sp. UYCP14C]RZF30305.1 helix-hairpin-helix domain-containing protein [Paraburkholderia sp. UYCP14C]